VNGDHLPDVVVFELADLDEVQALTHCVRTRWTVWASTHHAAGYLLGVDLGDTPEDLALLLRSVSQWAADQGLVRLVFRLDGRCYSLAPAGRTAGAARF